MEKSIFFLFDKGKRIKNYEKFENKIHRKRKAGNPMKKRGGFPMKKENDEEIRTFELGAQSACLPQPVFIKGYASVVGKKEGEGPFGSCFDVICEDDKFGEDTWEKSESAMQKEALALAIGKSGLSAKEVRYLFAGDLLGQNMATSFGLLDYEIPLFGLYGACSTAGESLSLAAMLTSAGYAEATAAITSSHFASAEKQFRFPLEYANQRPVSSTWTTTASGAFILSRQEGPVRITGITTGKIVDMGVRDSMNMGAAMAPAAADTILHNFLDFNRGPGDFDKIVTGDLGKVGRKILLSQMKEEGFDLSEHYEDCGIKMYENEEQKTGSGGSGCGCSAAMLAAHYLPELEKGNLNRILFVPTGALLSTVSFNEGENIPGIAHAVVLERNEAWKGNNKTKGRENG